jgi:hypothetical protein
MPVSMRNSGCAGGWGSLLATPPPIPPPSQQQSSPDNDRHIRDIEFPLYLDIKPSRTPIDPLVR